MTNARSRSHLSLTFFMVSRGFAGFVAVLCASQTACGGCERISHNIPSNIPTICMFLCLLSPVSLSLVASTAACNLNNFQLYSPLQVQLFTLFVAVHFPILSLLHARAAASVALFDLSTE